MGPSVHLPEKACRDRDTHRGADSAPAAAVKRPAAQDSGRSKQRRTTATGTSLTASGCTAAKSPGINALFLLFTNSKQYDLIITVYLLGPFRNDQADFAINGSLVFFVFIIYQASDQLNVL